jgi:hypothetical protein
MPLYIPNKDVNMNNDKVQKMQSVNITANQKFDERNLDVMAHADAIGINNPDFDMKSFSDEL